ncbi:hypothetical protein ACRRTK_020101 [Alexandromys fortis]
METIDQIYPGCPYWSGNRQTSQDTISRRSPHIRIRDTALRGTLFPLSLETM